MAAIIIGLHLSLVILSGLGFNPLSLEWNFENTGQFGDSFGPLTALFSALAAVSAFLAYRAQRDQLAESREALRADKLDSAKRDFENTFFKMLDLLRDVVKDVRIGSEEKPKTGLRGFSYALTMVYSHYEYRTVDVIRRNYKSMYRDYSNYFAHYFRLSYHILKYIDESDVADKKLYVRIFRANLSNAELVMLGLNAAFGSGSQKFLPLMAKHALLHNISASSARHFFLIDNLPAAVFGDRSLSADFDRNGH